MVNEIDEKIVNEILIPAGVWPISERITYSIASELERKKRAIYNIDLLY